MAAFRVNCRLLLDRMLRAENATGSEVAIEDRKSMSVGTPDQVECGTNSDVRSVMFICFNTLLRARHQRGGAGGAAIART